MKSLFTTILLTVVLGSFAQKVPDLDQIESTITNPGSKFYYPQLMHRYMASDSTLTSEDYYFLYYGYPFQSEYRPLMDSPYTDSLKSSFGRHTNPTPEEFERMARYCTKILEVEPFNLRDINALAFSYSMTGRESEAALEMRKVNMIAQTIKSTGSGLTDKSPWWVIYQSHIEDLLNLMNCNYTRAILISSTVEFIPVSNMEDKKQKGYYFNYSEIYRQKPDYLNKDNRPRRKLELNPWYNPKSKLNRLPK